MTNEIGPLVTAVIPIYNHEKYVAESIHSIIGQTYPNIELIVINDGSRDRSHENVLPLLEECNRRFVHFEYINRENVGLCATLNQALAMAKGTYFTILASDDVALPQKVELLVNALLERDDTYAAAFGDALYIDEEGRKLAREGDNGFVPIGNGVQASYLDYHASKIKFDYTTDEFGSAKTLFKQNYLPAAANIVKTKRLVEAHGWAEKNIVEDYEMWLKLARKYKFAYVDRPVALYRWHTTNSVKTERIRLNIAGFQLLSSEKRFCSTPEMLAIWKDAYRTRARRLVSDSQIPLLQRLRFLPAADPLNWSKLAIKWLIRR